MGGSGRDSGEAVEIAGVKFMGKVVKDVDPRDLKSLADEGKKTVGSGVVAFATVSPDGKGAIVVGVTDDLTPKFNAVELVRAGSSALGGKGGGGRPDMAQAGGPNGSKAQEALDAIRNAIAG
jgi:alanyl-tRNA synthetase